jgi:hypothetical protein
MCSLYNLSEHELLTNYDLFEKSLNCILGKAGNAILNIIKKEILIYAVIVNSGITVDDILNPSLKISDVVKFIHEAEIFDFVSNARPHHHTILLYSKENFRNKISEQFLNCDKSTFDNPTYRDPIDLLSNQTVDNDIDPLIVNNLSYGEILGQTINDISMKKLSSWIANLQSLNESQHNNNNNNNKSTTRIAKADGSMWLTNGYGEWLVSFEKLINKYKAANNMSMLCVFDISKISVSNMSTTLKQIISYHDSVITDNPFAIYNSRIPRTKIRARH